MRFVATFIILFVFWMVMAGKFDIFHASLGVISCLFVAYMSSDLLFKDKKIGKKIKEAIRFILYIPWLIYQIILANLHVVRLALSPNMYELIDPHIMRFKVKIKKDISKVTFANSITLTPGTITADIIDDEFVVHALSQAVDDDLMTGEMEQRVAHIYSED
jgi:multicomponent Na+:H+ antiporter subunit E